MGFEQGFTHLGIVHKLGHIVQNVETAKISEEKQPRVFSG